METIMDTIITNTINNINNYNRNNTNNITRYMKLVNNYKIENINKFHPASIYYKNNTQNYTYDNIHPASIQNIREIDIREFTEYVYKNNKKEYFYLLSK
jgi:hypothetical protein